MITTPLPWVLWGQDSFLLPFLSFPPQAGLVVCPYVVTPFPVTWRKHRGRRGNWAVALGGGGHLWLFLMGNTSDVGMSFPGAQLRASLVSMEIGC